MNGKHCMHTSQILSKTPIEVKDNSNMPNKGFKPINIDELHFKA